MNDFLCEATNLSHNFCGAKCPQKLLENCLFSVLSRVSRAKGIIILALFCSSAAFAGAAEIYYTNRTFTVVGFGNQINRPTDILNAESKKLTNIVKGAAIQLDSNGTYAIERNAVALGHNSAAGAWNAAVNYNYERNHNGEIFDNVGWVRGTKLAHGEWGAYLWTLRNRIAFKSSATNIWVSSNGIPVAISNVFVGSLGVYGPMSNVVDIGPDISPATNFPGEGQSGAGTYYVDITNVYYQLVIPDIWITPRDVVVAVGSSNTVRFTVTGTNITNGVTWTLNPSGLSGGAEMQTNGYWYYRDVMPGNVATNYTIRAAAADNTNFYDEVNLTVAKVELSQANNPETLCSTNTLSVIVQPAGLSISSNRFESRQATGETWSIITNTTLTTISIIPKTPGYFKRKVISFIKGAECVSPEVEVETRFPHNSTIAGNSVVEVQRSADWTAASGTNGDHNERGGWIYLNTETCFYRIETWPVGTFFGVNPTNSPLDSGYEYFVGEYHLHATLRDTNDIANATNFPIGPSQEDIDAATASDTPGLLRDRHADEIVETGHTDYFYGPIRRTTPQ